MMSDKKYGFIADMHTHTLASGHAYNTIDEMSKKASEVVVFDSLTNVLSVAAMMLTVRRAIEQWILWIVVNALEVYMWFRVWFEGGNNVSILLMWLLFLVNGIYLLRLWVKVGVEERRR